MTTPAVTPQTPNPLAEFGGVSVDAPTQATTSQPTTPSSPSTTSPLAEFGGIAIPDENTLPPAPKFAPYNAAAFGRYTTPENYEKWASTPPKSGPNARPGEYEAWTGANNPGGYKETLKNAAETTGYAGLAFGTAMGVTAIPEAAAALHELAVRHLASEVLPDLITNAGKEGAEIAYANAHARLLALAPRVLQAAKVLSALGTAGLSAEGIRSLWKIAAGSGK